MTDSVDALTASVATLAVQTSPAPPEEDVGAVESFNGATDAVPSFRTVEDLGVFVWNPMSPSKTQLKPHGDASIQDYASRIDSNAVSAGVAKLAVGEVRLPCRFPRSVAPQPLTNKFPNDPGVAGALAAAALRGLDFEKLSVDFVFGGSTLNVLATRSTSGNVYLAQLVKGAIAVGKHAEYTCDLSARGFQFERLVTGGAMAGKSSELCAVGMQVAGVGPFRVFFHAELDAVDMDTKERVEIKSGNPGRFGAKEMFQMVSSRSSALVFANCRGDMVQSIERRTLSQVASWLSQDKRATLHETLLKSMVDLKALAPRLSEDEPAKLVFKDDGSLDVVPQPLVSLLPKRVVLESIIQAPTQC